MQEEYLATSDRAGRVHQGCELGCYPLWCASSITSPESFTDHIPAHVDSTVTLLPLPSFAPSTPLVKAKGALSFAVNTSIQHLQPDGRPVDSDAGKSPKAIPTLITQLVIGCRRRVVIYSWRDGDAQDTKVCTALAIVARARSHKRRNSSFPTPLAPWLS